MIHSRDVHFNERIKDRELDSHSEGVAENDYELIADFSIDFDVEIGHDATQAEDEQPDPEDSGHDEQPRRSTRERKQPDYFGREHNSLCEVSQQPATYQEATEGPDKEKWKAAMETEMTSLQENEVWDLVKLPAGRKTVGSKWVYKIKTGADGSVQRYKARLVAQGFTQKYGTDFDETFCPVVRQESLRFLM